MTSTPRLSAHELTVRAPERLLVERLSADFAGGDFVAVLGQNGAGKSLTLRALAGLSDTPSGAVRIDGEPLAALTRRQIAKRLALLPQTAEDVFPARVFDTVLMGRHPHIEPLRLASAGDRDIAEQALRAMRLDAFAARDVTTLSGGERRRVAIAQILAQTPAIFLLDEPSNHLDPQYQLAVCELFAAKAREGATVIAVMHDVNLAARFANRALLLRGDGSWQLGRNEDVLTAPELSGLFDVEIEQLPWRDGRVFVPVSPQNLG